MYSIRSRDTWNRHWWYVYIPDDLIGSLSFQEATDKFFDDTNLRQCIDDLHAAVVDAKLRKQNGEVRPDIWREDLHPRASTRARTVPLLERERERLLAELQEVFPLTSLIRYRSCRVPVRGRKLETTRRDRIQRPSVWRKRETGGKFVGRVGRGRGIALSL